MTRFSYIDLSKLDPPDVVETLSFEAILQEMRDDLAVRDPDLAETLLESDPGSKILEAAAFREVLVRQRVNEGARAVMLAFAAAADLDQIGARYAVERLVLDPGDPDAIPPVAPTLESDDAFRARVQLAPEALTTAGSEGSYVFNTLSAGDTPSAVSVASPEPGKIVVTYEFDPDSFSVQVKDASVVSPAPGEVVVTVLSREGDGTASPEILAAVSAHLTGKYVRPLTDILTVQGATILNYAVDATLHLYDGPDAAVVLAEATAAFEAYREARHALGEEITESGIHRALQVSGVRKVVLNGWVDVTAGMDEAPFNTGLTLAVAA